MKAYNLHAVGDLRYEEVPLPEATDGSVLVKVRSCGICGSDIPRVYKNGTYHFPTIIGHEFSGEVVEATGNYRTVGVWAGKRVGVFPLLPCKQCPQCRAQRYEMCEHYSYLGSRTDGGFADFVAVPERNLIELPENVTFEQAAMLEPMAVAVHAIRRCLGQNVADSSTFERVDRDLSIAVCGMGTIGHLISMFLQALGFDHVREIRKGETAPENSVDVFFECVGKNETIIEALNAVNPGGRIQLVGNPATDMDLPQDVYWKILRKQLTLTGTWNSSFTHDENDDWHIVLKMLADGWIHPEYLITHRFPFAEGQLLQGFELMRRKSEPYIKVMGIA